MTASPLNLLGGLILCMGLASRIKEVKGDLSSSEFARMCKVSPASVTFWLDGTTKSLKGETAALMELTTGYRAQWIVTGKGPKKTTEQAEPQEDQWPFQYVERERVLALSGEQLAFVEGAMFSALGIVESPTPEDLARFNRSLASTRSKPRRKAA